MTKFRIKIVEDNGNTHIYTDASRVHINDDVIEVDYEGTCAVCPMDQVDDVRITKNHTED